MKNYYVHKVMSRNFTIPASYHQCVDEAERILHNLDCYPESTKQILLLTCLDLLKAGIRGCRKDINNDERARELQTEIYEHIIRNGLLRYLPLEYFHEVNRYCLWKEEMATDTVAFPFYRGKVEFKATRPAREGGWVLSATVTTVNQVIEEQTYTHPLYVARMGLKTPTIKVFPLYNENDNTLWGFEIYLQSPKKLVGCEFNLLTNRFSLYRDLTENTLAVEYLTWVNTENTLATDKRQGDKLFRFITNNESQSISDDYQEVESLSHDIICNKWQARGLYFVKNDCYVQHPDHRTIFIWKGVWEVTYVPGYNDYSVRNDQLYFND